MLLNGNSYVIDKFCGAITLFELINNENKTECCLWNGFNFVDTNIKLTDKRHSLYSVVFTNGMELQAPSSLLVWSWRLSLSADNKLVDKSTVYAIKDLKNNIKLSSYFLPDDKKTMATLICSQLGWMKYNLETNAEETLHGMTILNQSLYDKLMLMVLGIDAYYDSKRRIITLTKSQVARLWWLYEVYKFNNPYVFLYDYEKTASEEVNPVVQSIRELKATERLVDVDLAHVWCDGVIVK